MVNYLVSLVHKGYLFTSCGKNKSLVDQPKTNAVLNKVTFTIAKVLDKPPFYNFHK